MACISPGTITQTLKYRESTVNAELQHCDDGGYMYLSVSFIPKSIGARVCVQGFIHIMGTKGPQPATRKVIFHDDGKVTNYGDASNGVRFPQKRFHMNRQHKASMSISFLSPL